MGKHLPARIFLARLRGLLAVAKLSSSLGQESPTALFLVSDELVSEPLEGDGEVSSRQAPAIGTRRDLLGGIQFRLLAQALDRPYLSIGDRVRHSASTLVHPGVKSMPESKEPGRMGDGSAGAESTKSGAAVLLGPSGSPRVGLRPFLIGKALFSSGRNGPLQSEWDGASRSKGEGKCNATRPPLATGRSQGTVDSPCRIRIRMGAGPAPWSGQTPERHVYDLMALVVDIGLFSAPAYVFRRTLGSGESEPKSVWMLPPRYLM